MTDAGEQNNTPITFEITEDYLFNNFIQPFSKQALQDEQRMDTSIDPSKIDFSAGTVYDKHYYKDKFPLLDDYVCDILEACSVDKTQKIKNIDDGESNKLEKEMRKGVHFENKKTTVEFN
jgi:hypothetical protein